MGSLQVAAVVTVEQFEFHQTLGAAAGVSLVFFSSEECLSCRYWEDMLKNYIASHPDGKIFKVDAGRDQALTEEFGVFHLPALFLYNSGQFHSEIQCEANIDALDKAITTALAGPAQETP